VAGRCRREEDVTNKLFQAARPYTSDGQKYRVGHATIGLAFGAKLTVTSDETSVRRGATRRAQANAQRKWLFGTQWWICAFSDPFQRLPCVLGTFSLPSPGVAVVCVPVVVVSVVCTLLLLH
jgi:hypothetical protein